MAKSLCSVRKERQSATNAYFTLASLYPILTAHCELAWKAAPRSLRAGALPDTCFSASPCSGFIPESGIGLAGEGKFHDRLEQTTHSCADHSGTGFRLW